MRYLLAALVVVLFVTPSLADTTVVAPSTYKVDQGVAFSVSNAGFSDFLFSWSDASGTFTDIADPTLMLVENQTYTFTRTTTSHPFVITFDSLPVSGSAGSFQRTTTDGATIDGSTLSPSDEFTADPAPTADFISWTPQSVDVGNFFYTCRVTSHVGMTGAIEVVDKSVPTEENSWSTVKATFGR